MKIGVREGAFEALGNGAPDFLRLAVAHLAGMHAVDAGLVVPSAADAAAALPGPAEATVEESGECSPGTFHPADKAPVIILATSYLSRDLERAALDVRASGGDALPVVVDGGVTYVGPLLEPDASPCILCVQRCIAPNRQADALLERPAPGETERERLRQTARSWWHRRSSVPTDTILEIDGGGREVTRHHVRRFDDCQVCGLPATRRNGAPPRLRSVPSRPGSDTGSRITHPDEAYARFEHLVSPLTGAVRHVREVDTGAPGLIHVYTAGHAVRLGAASLREFMRDGRDHSGGKGGSAAQARVSALCEALERFSSVFRGDEVDAVGTRCDVEGALDPSDFLLFSNAQYAARQVWNRRTTSGFQKVPEPFDEGAEVAWSRVWSLISGTEAYVPTALLYLGFRGPGAHFCNADSNGLAAGQTLEEAVLQGFLELVERDAIALWWYNRTRQAAVDIESYDDDYVRGVFRHYESIGRRAWVLDLTSDLGIPVHVAVSARIETGPPEIIFGFGAHLDPSIALRRCVTEMNQMLATVMRPPEQRRGQLRGEFDDALDWWANAGLEGHPYLVPAGPPVSHGDASRAYRPTGDILDDVMSCLDIAHRHGLEVYIRDMTRSDLGLPVVKVLVPGLRHFWRRLAPGRLYEVPVEMGRLDANLAEAEMNPVSVFV
ncbi:MAG: TOMM precursor leader peptide-binding protein [Gemmatimonadetes bacterium]|nr:TOMM precursor leader peptide-binding protein [Gemmatimonadota bacterium]